MPVSSAAAVLANIFVSPREAMDSLVQRPRFLLALALLLLSGLPPAGITFERGVLAGRAREQAEPRVAPLPAAERQEYLDQAARAGAYVLGLGAVAGPVVAVVLLSGLLYGIALVSGANRAAFRAVCAVVAHAWLPIALYNLISVPILLAKEPQEIDLDNLIPLSNPAVFVEAGEHPALYRVAASLDLFSFWVIGLLTLGWARLTGRSFGASLPWILVPWALYVAVLRTLLR